MAGPAGLRAVEQEPGCRYTGPSCRGPAASLQLLQHCSTAAAVCHQVSVSTHSVTAEHSPPWPRTTAEHDADILHYLPRLEALSITLQCSSMKLQVYLHIVSTQGQLTRAASLAGVPVPGWCGCAAPCSCAGPPRPGPHQSRPDGCREQS